MFQKNSFPKRTRKESLLRLRELWSCIVEEKFEKKKEAYEFLGWEEGSDDSFCPACTFNITHKGEYCSYLHGGKCILSWNLSKAVWKEKGEKEKGCMSLGSPYDRWTYASSDRDGDEEVFFSPYDRWLSVFNGQRAAEEVLALVNKSIEKLGTDD